MNTDTDYVCRVLAKHSIDIVAIDADSVTVWSHYGSDHPSELVRVTRSDVWHFLGY